MTGARISSIGIALPERESSSAALADSLGVSESWIVERTGIEARRVAGEGQTAATLGTAAAQRALETLNVPAGDVDLVICATVTGAQRFPATACLIGAALGTSAPAFDLNAGCAGFLFALAQADAAVRSGMHRRVLLVGADVMSLITDPTDVKTSILFGDGAAAVVIEESDSPAIGPFALFSDGSRPELLCTNEYGHIVMEGREIYRAAVTGMTRSVEHLLRLTGLSAGDVDLVVAHQANQRILDAVAQRLDVDDDRVFSNIAHYGNTSAASIPLALYEAEQTGRLHDGDRVVLTAFGAGFCWGAGYLEWSPAPLKPQPLEERIYA